MKTLFTKAVIASSILFVGSVSAAEVLLKEILGNGIFSEAALSIWESDAEPYGGLDVHPYHWNPGFRTTTADGSVYLTGWTITSDDQLDGFLSRIDPAGAVVWTRDMRSVFGGSFNWRVNDVEAIGDNLYLCGTREGGGGNKKGFLAKLTLEGTLLEYSLVAAANVSGGSEGDAEGNALAIGSSGGETLITLVGDAAGSQLSVEQTQKNAGQVVFDGLVLKDSGRDAYVINFDSSLQPVWGSTFGSDPDANDGFGNDYATAVAADNTGALFVAFVTDANNSGSRDGTRVLFRGASEGERQVFYRDDSGINRQRKLGILHGIEGEFSEPRTDAYAHDFDPHGGALSVVYRIVPQRSEFVRGEPSSREITHHFFPIKLEGGESRSESRVTDLVYSNGVVFATGEYRNWLRPSSNSLNASSQDRSGGLNRVASSGVTSDIWLTKLSANDLKDSAWRIYQSAEEDFASQLTVGNDQSLYLSAISGGSLFTKKFVEAAATSVTASVGNNSSARHFFWQKLDTESLNPVPSWHIAPVEDTSNSIRPPGRQYTNGIGVTGDTVVLVGSWGGGDLTLGEESTRKTLIHRGGADQGFAGFVSRAGDFLEEVQIAINSDYGTPAPHGGPAGSVASFNTVAAGRTITASVPETVYEDESGAQLDPDDANAIRERAVTRRICTGYQFLDSTENGTANSVTFVADGDTELTFLWRTEFAVQIESELSNVDGLTSLSAGDPSPEANKHWIRTGEPLVASVNGWELDPAEEGVRWRSLGFLAEGVVASSAGLEDGEWFAWESLQRRQQTSEIVVNGPGKLKWLWVKEYRVRQAVNSSVAEGSPTTRWMSSNVLAGDYDASTAYWVRNFFSDNSYQYVEFPTRVSRDRLTITFNEGTPPAKLLIQTADVFHSWRDQIVVDVPVGTVEGQTITVSFPSITGRYFEVFGRTASNLSVSSQSSSWELQIGSRVTQEVRRGTGEIWAPADVEVTVTAPAEVDSGISTLSLKGYYQGQGNVSPAEDSVEDSEEDFVEYSRTFFLTMPSAITWNYARAIYPEEVTLGGYVQFSGVTGPDLGRIDTTLAPAAGSLLDGPEGSGFEDLWVWDKQQQRLYVLQPGRFTLEFVNQSERDDAAQRIIVEVTSAYPDEASYTHIIETPPVELDTSAEDGATFVGLSHTESRASVSGSRFSASEPGRSVLLFSHRSDGAATGDLDRESLSVKVVNSIRWSTSAGSESREVTVGEEVEDVLHDAEAVGHNGYVIQNTAPVNGVAYDRPNLAGPIFPVNSTGTDQGALLAHFPLNEGNGSFANELSQGGGAIFRTSKVGGVPIWRDGGADFTIADAEQIEAIDPTLGNLTQNELTLSALIKPDTFVEWGGIVTKGIEKAPYSLTVTSAGKLRFGVNIFSPLGDAQSTHHFWDSSSTLNPSVFSRVAVTYDGSHVRLFINDVEDLKVPANFTFGRINEPLVIGADLPGGDERFDGVIRDVRVYNRALTASELVATQSGWLGHEPFAVAWYRVEDGIRWPYVARNYSAVWPENPDRIVIASRLGSESLSKDGSSQPEFGGELKSPEIYQQPDEDKLGFNPNEENALITASFLENERPAVFALRRDLNTTSTSLPYVMVQYEDHTNVASPEIKMKVYAVEEEDPALSDARLPVNNQRYSYFYQNEAGLRLVPPYPLDAVLSGSPTPDEVDGLNIDGRISYYEDKNQMPWCVSGDEDAAADIEVEWHYPLRADFWHPSKGFGEVVSFGKLTSLRPRNILYNTVWPEDSAVLKAGETLTFAGGEYATDNSDALPQPEGLPQAVSWQSAKLVFDEKNVDFDPEQLDQAYLARVFSSLTTHEVALAFDDVPASLQPAAGGVIVEGLLWRFKDLPANLQQRVFYNTSTENLSVRGLLNERVLGDGDLLASPGAQTILQPNVLVEEDEILLGGLSSDATWLAAVAALGNKSRDPNGTSVDDSFGIGLVDGLLGVEPANELGPGLVVVTSPALQHSAGSGGYITIAENDHPDLPDSPVAMHVIRVSNEKYRGSVAVMEPENVFDEKVTLRHTADFGGDAKDLYFQWIIREEDGLDLNPPEVNQPTSGSSSWGDWEIFTQGEGLFEAQLTGSGEKVIRDNVVFCRYRHVGDTANWSAWAGAANSRPPNPTSPSVATDQAYVAQLVPGWVKRVAEAINLFDARYSDFANSTAPATYTSALLQAGQRWEGPVAFNPEKDAIENTGLIEIYETVLDRAEAFTIVSNQGSIGVNTALLNAANRIAGLYTLLGNEAYSDALDPMIGFGTNGGQFGSLAPTIHAFQNQAGNLLDEELALLRGRSERGARPAYNRLLWNFTNGEGEAAYVLNYGINDLTEDGFLDDEDARRLYPQGHGDAWGHYSMALKGYYELASESNFDWAARSEKYSIDGVVLDIDYQDERAFAKAAAARARTGAELIDLTYRQAYTENPNGQWQGYQDLDDDRAWGVFETAQRVSGASFCDWLFVNAMLPAVETDPAKTGIRRVDRTTVGELAEIAQQASRVQSNLDLADQGLNPAGLNPDAIPFDIDPVLTDLTHVNAATHFEQVYQRATAAAGNTKRTFDYANDIAVQLRQTEASSESLRQQAIDQDRSLRNQMIEIFGSPYSGTIGSGRAYPEGYNGPDLYLWMYVDLLAAGGDTVDELSDTTLVSTTVGGLRNLAFDSNPFTTEVTPLDDLLKDAVSTYFPADVPLPEDNAEELDLQLPRRASGYGLVAPEGWGERRAPGEIQAALQELVQAEWRVRSSVAFYESQSDDFKLLLRSFEIKSGIAAERIQIVREALDDRDGYTAGATASFAAAGAASLLADFSDDTFDALNEALPKIVGLSNDATAPARGILGTLKANLSNIAKGVSLAAEVSQYRLEIEAEDVLLEMEQDLLTEELKSELLDILAEIQQMVNDEDDFLHPIIAGVESMRLASDRVRMAIEKGQALLAERTVFNQRVAASTTQQRYEDFTFRIFHNDALNNYRASFDAAARYAYLAGKAYQYELNLPTNHSANAAPLLAEMLRERSLGNWDGGVPVLGAGGLAEHLAVLEANYDTLKGQLGFNNPSNETAVLSLRRELARIGMSSRVNADWRTKLESWRVPDLWNYEFLDSGVNYGYVFRRFCRPFAPESAGAQPGLVIPFTSTIEAGKNWFGEPVEGGDHVFSSSSFSTKIRSVGVRFDGYNNLALSQSPQAYLVPLGSDQMFLSNSNNLASRSWTVVEQRIPAPIAISSSNLSDPDWQPFSGSSSGYFEDLRKFSSFRAYHDAGGWALDDMVSESRLVGRSIWNTQWVLIIPSVSLLADSGNDSAGIDTLIHGAPLPGFTQETAGTTLRDQVGVQDIRLLLKTYSVSGN